MNTKDTKETLTPSQVTDVYFRDVEERDEEGSTQTVTHIQEIGNHMIVGVAIHPINEVAYIVQFDDISAWFAMQPLASYQKNPIWGPLKLDAPKELVQIQKNESVGEFEGGVSQYTLDVQALSAYVWITDGEDGTKSIHFSKRFMPYGEHPEGPADTLEIKMTYLQFHELLVETQPDSIQ